MATVAIKGRKEGLQVIIQPYHAFGEVEAELKQQLQYVHTLSNQQDWSAQFHIPAHCTAEELYRLFTLTQQYGGCISGFLQDEVKQLFACIDRPLHCGECIDIYQPTIVLGNIKKDVFVSAYADVFVMGAVSGTIHMKSKDASVHAMSFYDANLQYFDVFRPSLTNHAPSTVYYNEETQEVETKIWQK